MKGRERQMRYRGKKRSIDRKKREEEGDKKRGRG